MKFLEKKPIDKIDTILEFLINQYDPPYVDSSFIAGSLKIEYYKELFEILHTLEEDGYVKAEIITISVKGLKHYGSTFKGRLFYMSGGYKAKALKDEGDALSIRMEARRRIDQDELLGRNSTRLNTLTSRQLKATVFAAIVGLLVLAYYILSWRFPHYSDLETFLKK